MDQTKKKNPRTANSDLQPIASLESLSPASNQTKTNPFGSNNTITNKQVQQQVIQRTQHVLIIDGAYFQIGLKDLNFSVDTPSSFHALLRLFEQIAGHQFDQIRFVTSEDHETYAKNARFYEEVLKKTHRQVYLDIRQYKQKSAKCRCGCKEEIKWKVQAEVDVAIAVYLLDYALCSYIESITLFAGDRDFIDSIRYAQQRLGTNVTIMGFENNAGQPLLQSGMFIDVMQQIITLQKERANLTKPMHNMMIKGANGQPSQKQLSLALQRPVTPDKAKLNPELAESRNEVVGEAKVTKKTYKGRQDIQWSIDPKIQELLRVKLPEKQTFVKGTFFLDESFPEETLRLLMRHPLITKYDAEHAIYTLDGESDDVEALLRFIFNGHHLLTGKYTLEHSDSDGECSY